MTLCSDNGRNREMDYKGQSGMVLLFCMVKHYINYLAVTSSFKPPSNCGVLQVINKTTVLVCNSSFMLLHVASMWTLLPWLLHMWIFCFYSTILYDTWLYSLFKTRCVWREKSITGPNTSGLWAIEWKIQPVSIVFELLFMIFCCLKPESQEEKFIQFL